jgi:hypothetical protein
MKKCFEIIFCEEWEETVRCERVGRPKEKWRQERSNENSRGEVGCQSSCVFQAG